MIYLTYTYVYMTWMVEFLWEISRNIPVPRILWVWDTFKIGLCCAYINLANGYKRYHIPFRLSELQLSTLIDESVPLSFGSLALDSLQPGWCSACQRQAEHFDASHVRMDGLAAMRRKGWLHKSQEVGSFIDQSSWFAIFSFERVFKDHPCCGSFWWCLRDI